MLPLANVIEDAFSPLISFFESIMVFIHDNLVGGSWGLAIIGLTVLIRAVLVPLTYRQLKGMQEMQRLSPQIAALKEKYKDDKQRQQQEIMAFYRENKINPLASCLPLLLQLPVFISLFYMLRTDLKLDICGQQLRQFYSQELGRHIVTNAQIPQNAVHVAGHAGKLPGLTEVGCSTPFHYAGALHTIAPGSAKFLFLPDITYKATGAALIVLILLYVGSQVASTLVATATADPNQRRLMLLLPLVFVVILYRYPAGLLVYWITTNLWTIVQQAIIKKRIGPLRPPTPEGETPPTLMDTLRSLGGGDSKPQERPKPRARAQGAAVARAGGGQPKARPAGPPPPSPRKKKKRSGRRR